MASVLLLSAATADARPKTSFVPSAHPAKAVRDWQFRQRVTPYRAPDRTPLALPWPIVECESGGRFHDPSAPNGGYALLTGPLQGVPTWEDWRPSWAGEYAAPYQAPKKAQDIAAHRLLIAYGLSPWECAGIVGLL